MRTLDVKQAFLQSDELEWEVYILPPIEAGLDDKTVWKLRVAVYGLADASREWYKTSRRLLNECGLMEVTTEPSLFYSVDEQGRLDGILAAHVDDFLYGGEINFLNKVETFKAKVRVGATERDNVIFCGLNISRNGQEVHVKATEAMGVQKYPVQGIDKLAELTHAEETWARSVIGKLQWSAQSHRPDLCYVLGQALGNLTSQRKKTTLIECNKIIDYYHEHEDMNLIFQPLGGNLELEVYGDSASKEHNHQDIVVVLRMSGQAIVNVLGWKSKRAERRAWSTLAAETHVLQHALDKSIHIHEVLKQLRQPIIRATVLTDNLSLRRCLYSGRPSKEERLRKEFAAIRDLMGTEMKHVRFVPGDQMPADCLTKKTFKENSLVKMINQQLSYDPIFR